MGGGWFLRREANWRRSLCGVDGAPPPPKYVHVQISASGTGPCLPRDPSALPETPLPSQGPLCPGKRSFADGIRVRLLR